MLLAEVLGRWNVAARGQSREFFNTIGGKLPFGAGAQTGLSYMHFAKYGM